MPPRLSLPRMLLDAGLADVATLGLATAIATEADVPVVHALLRWHLVDAEAFANVLSRHTGLPVHRFSADDGVAPSTLDRAVCHRWRVVPLERLPLGMRVGMVDPTDDVTARQLAHRLGCEVVRALLVDYDVDDVLRRLFGADDRLALDRPSEAGRRHTAPTVEVYGEASQLGAPLSDLVDDADAAMFLDPPPAPRAPGFLEERSLSEVFGSDTVDMPMPAGRRSGGMHLSVQPTHHPASPSSARLDDVTREVAVGELLADAEETLQQPISAPAPPLVSAEERTIPNDSLLYLMRVLVVAPPELHDGVLSGLRTRVKYLGVVAPSTALQELQARRVDGVVVVAPPTGEAHTLVRQLAERAKAGVWVLSPITGLAAIPGVRGVQSVGATTARTVDTIVGLLTAQAIGEGP